MDSSKNKIAILIISCDKYSDLWQTCANMFEKFWADCRFDKFIVSNFKNCTEDGFQNIKIGADKSWSHGLKLALNHLESNYEYVFTMVEDYYFNEKIDNNYIVSMFDEFVKSRGNFLSLFKLPSKLYPVNEFYGALENHIPYRQSIGFTLWKIDILNSILAENENAWEFEKNGVVRGFQYDNFFGSYKNYKVMNLVIKGKLVPKEYRVLKTYFPEIKINRLEMSKKELFIEKLREYIITSFLFFAPTSIKRRLYFPKHKFNIN
jgi:hypothetical protein